MLLLHVKMTGALLQQTVVIAFYTNTLKNMHDVKEKLFTYLVNARYYGKSHKIKTIYPSLGKLFYIFRKGYSIPLLVM